MKLHLGRLFFGVGLAVMLFASIVDLKSGSGFIISLGLILTIILMILSASTEW